MVYFAISGKHSHPCRSPHSHPVDGLEASQGSVIISPHSKSSLRAAFSHAWFRVSPHGLGLVIPSPPTNPRHEDEKSSSYGLLSPCCCPVDPRCLSISVSKNFHSVSSQERYIHVKCQRILLFLNTNAGTFWKTQPDLALDWLSGKVLPSLADPSPHSIREVHRMLSSVKEHFVCELPEKEIMPGFLCPWFGIEGNCIGSNVWTVQCVNIIIYVYVGRVLAEDRR